MSARITGSRARWSEALAIIEARCAMVSGGVRRRLDRILRARHRDGDSGRARVTDEPRATFFSLTPNRVLEAVEVGGLRCTGRCLPLRAFENRVYEVELDLGTGGTLGEIEGIHYAAFPKVRGRTLDELDAEQRRLIGRTIGRMHAVGAARDAPQRPRLDVTSRIREPVETLITGNFIPGTLAPRYRDVALRIADAVAAPLAAARAQRIHGDLHWGNMLWTSEGPILVDFDECLVGPPVQDLWLLARGDSAEARRGREDLLEVYELFREFDRSTLALCEPLRALRIVYMSGWIARRWDDPAFPPAFPNFRDHRYWMQEYEELVAISEALDQRARWDT